MLYLLDTLVGNADDGRLYIHINSYHDGSQETFAWERQGKNVNTGDVFDWQHNGTNYFIRLTYAGVYYASIFSDGWRMPPNSNGEPPRPWFRRSPAVFSRGTGFRPSVPGPQAYNSFPVDFRWFLV